MMQAGPINSPRMLAKSICEFFRICLRSECTLPALAAVATDSLTHIGHKLLCDVARGGDIAARRRVVECRTEAAEFCKIVDSAVFLQTHGDLADSVEVAHLDRTQSDSNLALYL